MTTREVYIPNLLRELQSVYLDLLDANDMDGAGTVAMALDAIVSAWQAERI